MELFDQLNVLYARLVKETDDLNCYSSHQLTNNSTDSNHGFEVLNANLTSVRDLKVS
jgi:hypothetical protein